MLKSSRLRVADVRAIWELLGECRELGDGRIIWRDHCVSTLARLIDADFGVVGEMGGCDTDDLRDLGANFWWRMDLPSPSQVHSNLAAFRDNPRLSPALLEYHRLNRSAQELCLTRRDYIGDRDWYQSYDYEVIHQSYGTDATLFCFRQLVAGGPGESSGIVMLRAKGRRDFSGRDRALVRETNARLSRLVGKELARCDEPTPRELAPRCRQVLIGLLQGEGDKQVAARLSLGMHTVNEYTKLIYRHFGVRGRSELMARWIKRGWSDRFAWAELERARSGVIREVDSGYVVHFDADHEFQNCQ